MSKKEEIYIELGEVITIKRKQLGLNQSDLATAAKLTRTSLTNIESGRQRVQLHTLDAVARALGCSIAELLPGEEIMRPRSEECNLSLEIPLSKKRYFVSVPAAMSQEDKVRLLGMLDSLIVVDRGQSALADEADQ